MFLTANACAVRVAHLPSVWTATGVLNEYVVCDALRIGWVAMLDQDAGVDDGDPLLPIIMQPVQKCLQTPQNLLSS